MGGHLARPGRRLRRGARQRHGARDPRGGPRESRVHLQIDRELRVVSGRGPEIHAGLCRAGDGRTGRGDSRRRARLREGGKSAAVLDAGHHRAPQRARQRLRAHQPGAPDGSRGPLGIGGLPSPRTEQRAGRRGHGRPAQQAAGRPRRREPGVARGVGARLGRPDSPPSGLAPLADVRGNGAREVPRAVRPRRKPGPVGGRSDAGDASALGARLHPRAGHVPDADRRDGARGSAGRGLLVRGRRHGHLERAPRPARSQGARSAGAGEARPGDPRRARQSASAWISEARWPSRSGTRCARFLPGTAA